MKKAVTWPSLFCLLLLPCVTVPWQCLAAEPEASSQSGAEAPASQEQGPSDAPVSGEGEGQNPEDGTSDAEKIIQGYIDHIREREKAMDERYGVSGGGAALKKFLAGQGISAALEPVADLERVPFAVIWGDIRQTMYSAAKSELGEEIAAVREDPSSAPKNVAALAALMNEWDQIEQTVRELFQHALNQTLMIARLREKAIQVQAGLTDTDLQIQEVQRTRDEVFSEIKRRAQERPSFLSSGTEAPLSYGSQDPGKAGQDETLSLPPGPGARRTAVGRGNLEEAAEKASAAEEAVRRASGAVEEAKRNVGAMGKNYEKCRDSADKMRRNYNRARSGNRDDADQLRSESRSADRMAEQALEDLRAAERKAESAAENLDSARREAARARDEYNTLKDASEKA